MENLRNLVENIDKLNRDESELRQSKHAADIGLICVNEELRRFKIDRLDFVDEFLGLNKRPASTQGSAPTNDEATANEVALVTKLRDCIRAAKSALDVEKLARIAWPVGTSERTEYVSANVISSKHIRVLILEEGSAEDEDLLARLWLIFPETRAAEHIDAGSTALFSSRSCSGLVDKESPLFSMPTPTRTVLIGKVRKGDDLIHQVTAIARLMHERLRQAVSELRAEKSIGGSGRLCVAVNLPAAMNVVAGRKILECCWRDIEARVQIAVKIPGSRKTTARPRLGTVTLQAKANTNSKFQEIYAKIKQTFKPSVHRIEIHKIRHLDNGDILLRVKEIDDGGKKSFSEDIQKAIGVTTTYK